MLIRSKNLTFSALEKHAALEILVYLHFDGTKYVCVDLGVGRSCFKPAPVSVLATISDGKLPENKKAYVPRRFPELEEGDSRITGSIRSRIAKALMLRQTECRKVATTRLRRETHECALCIFSQFCIPQCV